MKILSTIFFAVLGTAHSAEYSALMSVDEMIREADDVVHGHVVRMHHKRDATGMIETEVEVEVDDAFRQQNRARIHFDIPGGEWEGVRLTVPGTPIFSNGDEVVVFLRDDAILGLGQGALFLKADHMVQEAIPQDARVEAPVEAIMGSKEEAKDCLKDHRQIAFVDGWQVRGSLDSGLVGDSVRGVAISLMAGLTYRLGVCVDGQSESTRVTLTDTAGQRVAEKYMAGLQETIEFTAPETGQYLVAVESGPLKTDKWRSRFGLNIAFK